MRLSIDLDIRAQAGRSFQAIVDEIREMERAGLDAIWAHESYGFDAPTAMGYLAARTERLLIGSAILPLFTRTPALLAQTAAGLDYLSGGRAILGLGASGPQVIEGFHGVPFDRPLQRTREIVDICRRVWRREALEYAGECFRLPLPPEHGTGLGRPLKLIDRPPRPAIPIYIGSLGQRSVELTAEIADGWMPLFFSPEKVGLWADALRRGAARRPAALGPLEIVAGGPVAIGEGVEALRDLGRPRLALYGGGMGARGKNFYNDLFRQYGYESEMRTIQDLFLAGRRDEAAAAVPARLLEETSLIGPPAYVKERIAAYRQAGVGILNVTPVGPTDPVRTIATLRELIDSA